MLATLYLAICAAFLSDFGPLLTALGPAAQLVSLLPEACSGLLLAYVVLHVSKNGSVQLSPKYVFIGTLLFLHIVLGIVLNSVQPGAVVNGMRAYFKFVPLFCLPIVRTLTEAEIRSTLRFILVLCLAQLPVCVYQRLFVFPNLPSGDVIRGTFVSGAVMSIVLVSAITLLVGFRLRGLISLTKVSLLGVLLAIPTFINETKGTIFLFPVALLGIAIHYGTSRQRAKVIAGVSAISIVFILLFSQAYNFYFGEEGVGAFDFITEGVTEQLYKYEEDPRPGNIGRIASVLYAYNGVNEDALQLLFGFGVGNVANPDTQTVIRGEHGEYYENYGAAVTTYSFLLWEVGVIGIVLVLMLVGCGIADAQKVSQRDDFSGALALGWIGVLYLVPLAMLYKELVNPSGFGFAAMLISGYVAAARFSIVQNQIAGPKKPPNLLIEQNPIRPIATASDRDYAR